VTPPVIRQSGAARSSFCRTAPTGRLDRGKAVVAWMWDERVRIRPLMRRRLMPGGTVGCDRGVLPQRNAARHVPRPHPVTEGGPPPPAGTGRRGPRSPRGSTTIPDTFQPDSSTESQSPLSSAVVGHWGHCRSRRDPRVRRT
jgi:hypothetical protein